MSKRKDCFFGLHFDFHAQENHTGIGEHFDDKVLEDILNAAKPDFVQCDSKGIHGISSYPTKVGNFAPSIHTDILRKWRDITKKYGVLLYAHHAGIWDKRSAKNHPEWAAVDADGKFTEKMSVFGEYADNLLIQQLKEIALDYGLDGAWVDGECASVVPDYSDAAKKAYKKIYGEDKLPKPGDADYRKFQDFCRKGFFDYIRHYVTEVKNAAPDFEITSNWLNSTQVPDSINITDYISGDFEPTNSVESARYNGRVIADYKRTWDLMAWAFRFPGIMHMKTAVMLCQEAAAIIMLGGAFQVYNLQTPDRAVKHDWIVPILKEVAEFCRARQDICFKANPIPEAAVLFSLEAFYEKKTTLFRTGDYSYSIRGLTNLLLDNQISTEIMHSPSVSSRDLSQYSFIALCNSKALEKDVKQRLLKYAEGGGTLILTGADTAALFAGDLNLRISEIYLKDPILEIACGVTRDEIRQPYVKVLNGDSCVSFMRVMNVNDDLSYADHAAPVQRLGENIPSALRIRYGKGTVAVAPFDAGTAYWQERSSVIRDFVGKYLIPAEDIKLNVCGSHYVDVALMQKGGCDYIHFLNMAGEHRDMSAKVFDEIPPLYNIGVEYKCGKKPQTVTLLPQNVSVDFAYSDGKIKFKLEKLEIHTAAQIKY